MKAETNPIQERIRDLLKERNGVLLAHNYQPPDIQEAADLCGDSLELSIKASQTDAEVIVFCGVHFMAETASILCPDKRVLLPVPTAGCPMADMITANRLRAAKKDLPDAVVVSYVNTTAEVKAESDICCTSANAVQVALSVDPDRPIFMTPDKNLAQYTRKESGRDIRYWDGFCPIHDGLTAARAGEVKAAHPDALFLAHPECRPEVLDLADEVKSTSGMMAFAAESDSRAFVIATETGILHPLRKANPNKMFIPADPGMVCADMKKTALNDVLAALETLSPEIRVPDDIRVRAKGAVDRMLAIPGS
jgi:quinolinate synthase